MALAALASSRRRRRRRLSTALLAAGVRGVGLLGFVSPRPAGW
jgi:hypothetical protein